MSMSMRRMSGLVFCLHVPVGFLQDINKVPIACSDTASFGISCVFQGDFAVAAVLITMGAVLGKVTSTQLVVVCVLEIFFYALSEAIVSQVHDRVTDYTHFITDRRHHVTDHNHCVTDALTNPTRRPLNVTPLRCVFDDVAGAGGRGPRWLDRHPCLR